MTHNPSPAFIAPDPCLSNRGNDEHLTLFDPAIECLRVQDSYPAMPEKSFIIRLNEFVFIFVYFATDKGEVGNFVVKLNILEGDDIFELARYDNGLHGPHLDILHPEGYKQRIVDFGMLENAQTVNVAIEDFTNNWELYYERWQKWLKEKK